MRVQGKITKIDKIKGFGFAVTTGRDPVSVFFHRSALRGVMIEDLQAGQLLDLEVDMDAPRGPRAESAELTRG